MLRTTGALYCLTGQYCTILLYSAALCCHFPTLTVPSPLPYPSGEARAFLRISCALQWTADLFLHYFCNRKSYLQNSCDVKKTKEIALP